YPAGGQQGTTFQVRLGGQRIEGIDGAWITGPGVTVKLVKYYQAFGNQEVTLMREQLKELKQEMAQKAKVEKKAEKQAEKQEQKEGGEPAAESAPPDPAVAAAEEAK